MRLTPALVLTFSAILAACSSVSETSDANGDATTAEDSPLVSCHGAYTENDEGSQQLDRTAQGCQLGEYYLLNVDGSVTRLKGGSADNSWWWQGDKYLFRVGGPNATALTFQLIPGTD